VSHRGTKNRSSKYSGKDSEQEPVRRIRHSLSGKSFGRSSPSTKRAQRKKHAKRLNSAKSDPETPLRMILWRVYKSIPSKPLLLFGIFCSLLSGAVTPVFSFLLSKLLFEISIGARDHTITNLYGGIILAIAFADGLFNGLKFFIMEICAVSWVNALRKTIYVRVLKQDKKWFDKPENKSEGLVHVLFKDGEDARLLVGRILGQSFVVFAMLGLGLVWALVLGWQLTLAGFAIVPIFAGVMSIQATLVSKFQKGNKDCHEVVAKGYHEVSG
jgi:ATP-binding cassette, subfamily B (MDR/TAP), member 1